ncbi:MAG: hypothetical protein LEGION0398_MBIBDBAK_00340 [Legionellaceae bacterium]
MIPSHIEKQLGSFQKEEVTEKLINYFKKVKQDARFAIYLETESGNEGYDKDSRQTDSFLNDMLEQLAKDKENEQIYIYGVVNDIEKAINEALDPIATDFITKNESQEAQTVEIREKKLKEIYNRVIHYTNLLMKTLKTEVQLNNSEIHYNLVNNEGTIKKDIEEYFIRKFLQNFSAKLDVIKNPSKHSLFEKAIGSAQPGIVQRSHRLSQNSANLGIEEEKPKKRSSSLKYQLFPLAIKKAQGKEEDNVNKLGKNIGIETELEVDLSSSKEMTEKMPLVEKEEVNSTSCCRCCFIQ